MCPSDFQLFFAELSTMVVAYLPAELWDMILVRGGPLSLLTDRIRITHVAIKRIQWRARASLRRRPPLLHGSSVAVFHAGAWKTGRLILIEDKWVVVTNEATRRYLFLEGGWKVRK